MIIIKQKGSFDKTDKFLKNVATSKYTQMLEKYAKEGVNALASATPVDSGETANSWGYNINRSHKGFVIEWTNSHIVDGVPIAILIQYGHATGSGGYVQGRDYINPVLRPIFDKILNDVWREVTQL